MMEYESRRGKKMKSKVLFFNNLLALHISLPS